MRTRRISKNKYKNLKGIIVPQASYSADSLALLTTEGQTIPIAKNEKFNFLQNLLWESVSVFGRVFKDSSKKEILEVIFFTTTAPSNMLLDTELGHPIDSTCA